MRTLELKIPPGVVALLTGGLMWVTKTVTPPLAFDFPGRWLGAAVLFGLGAASAGWGVAAFRRAQTTMSPTAPERVAALVTTGIYRWTRNPMYAGLVLAAAGWALGLGNAAAFVGVPALAAYLQRFQIRPEERVLAARFGADYAAYCARVRRWV